MKIKRILADCIDLLGIYLILLFLALTFQPQPYLYSDIINFIILYIPFLIGYVLIICKDIIFGHKSLGKRIMKLNVYDKNEQLILSKKTLICRNIVSCWLLPLNILFILLQNKTFGDYVMRTQVLQK